MKYQLGLGKQSGSKQNDAFPVSKHSKRERAVPRASAQPSLTSKERQRGNSMTKAEIKAERARLGISQGLMAQRLGVSLRTISYYEKGEVPVPKTVELLIQSRKDVERLTKELQLADNHISKIEASNASI